MKDKKDFFGGSGTPFFTIMDYIHIIRERWMFGVAAAVLLAGLFSLYMFSRTPEYTSSVQLLVGVAQENIVDMDQVIDETEIARSNNRESLFNHYLIEIRSRKFRSHVVSELDKRTIERIIKPYRTPELAEPNVSDILEDAIKISLNIRGMVYTISATHRDAVVAADLANLYAAKYLEYVLSDVGSSNASALSFLRKNAEKMQRSILEDQQALERLQKEHRIISIKDSRNIAIGKIISLSERRTELNAEKQNFDTILRQLEIRGVGVDIEDDSKILAALEVTEISLFGGIEAIKTDLDKALMAQKEIEFIYLEKHPKYIQNNERIADLRSRLKAEISLAIKSFLTSSKKLAVQIEKNSESIALLEEETQRLDDLAIIFQGLETKIANDKATLAQIESRLNETIISSQLSKANMRVIDEAVAIEPYIPSYPNHTYTIAVAVLLFGLGFFVLPIVLNYMDDRLKTSWDVEEFIGKPLLGEVVLLKKEQQQNIHNLVTESEDSSIVDIFRSIYNTIKLNTPDVDRKIQVVTSTVANEGKTMFSINYAVVCAQHGKRVLLIDCNLRKPRIQVYTGTTTDTGLVHWFDEGADLSSANDQLYNMLGIHQLEGGVYLLPAGKATNSSTELVESQAFRRLIKRLSDEFDNIIIDTPPLELFPDAMFIADYAQQIIYVSRFNKVSRAVVKRSIQRLDQTAATVCGVVINRKKMKRRGHGYYGSYASNY